MRHVTSRLNPVVARYRAAARGDDRRAILLDGPHLVADALASPIVVREALASTDALGRPEIRALVDRLEALRVPVQSATSAVIAAASPVRSSSGIVALADRPEAAEAAFGPPALVVIAWQVQDPGNLGALARVAEAGGATGLLVAGASADAFGWKALRGSMGSLLRLPVIVRHRGEEAIADARAHRCRIVAAVPRGGDPLFDSDMRGPTAILIGGEGAGLPGDVLEQADQRVTIPMQPPVESLNTAVAAALVVYEALRQRVTDTEASHRLPLP
jgi:TrmH family RNA methyltransferase